MGWASAAVCFLLAALLSESSGQGILAGVSKVNGSLPIGVPLAGYNHGARRYELWPLIHSTPYTSWMSPSVGIMDPTWVKALIIQSGNDTFGVVTIDAIGSTSEINQMAYDIAVQRGFTIPFDNIIFSSSHSHSGPGGIDSHFLWNFAPATDLLIPSLQRQMASSVADAMLQAVANLQPALIGIGLANLTGVTQNRRAGISPYVTSGTIDPNLGVIRVDAADGQPMAVLWNFAIHGTCYGPDNMLLSGDIMGKANEFIEDKLDLVALFVNGDAGDIDPTSASCWPPPNFNGSYAMAAAVGSLWSSIQPSGQLSITTSSYILPFGSTDLNATLSRFDNCTSGGPLDICTLCEILQCDVNAHLDEAWIENTPRFTGVLLEQGSETTLIVTIPGEGLVELGWQIRNDTLKMGFPRTFLFGYSNNHMGYFATPNEYDVGGYESQLTFWGIDTAEKVRNGTDAVAGMLLAKRNGKKQ